MILVISSARMSIGSPRLARSCAAPVPAAARAGARSRALTRAVVDAPVHAQQEQPAHEAGVDAASQLDLLAPDGAAAAAGDRARLRLVQGRARSTASASTMPAGRSTAARRPSRSGAAARCGPAPRAGHQALQQSSEGAAAKDGRDTAVFFSAGHARDGEQRPQLGVLGESRPSVVELLAQGGSPFSRRHVEQRPRVPAGGPASPPFTDTSASRAGVGIGHGMGLGPGFVVKRASVLCCSGPEVEASIREKRRRLSRVPRRRRGVPPRERDRAPDRARERQVGEQRVRRRLRDEQEQAARGLRIVEQRRSARPPRPCPRRAARTAGGSPSGPRAGSARRARSAPGSSGQVGQRGSRG